MQKLTTRQWILLEMLLLGNLLLFTVLAIFVFGSGLAAAQLPDSAAPTTVLLVKAPAGAPPAASPTPASTAGPQPALAPIDAERAVTTALPSRTPTSVSPALSATPAPTLAPTLAPTAVTRVLLDVPGQAQSLPLSCESRSAADWAAYFGVTIDELEFFFSLPHSDNPDAGFSGDVNGKWGQVPPEPYGVHAGPVAAHLRDYGLNAEARRDYTWEEARQEVTEGRPIIAWVVGHVWASGKRVEYTALDGTTVLVAPYEHTVILVGFDESNAIVRDGSKLLTRPLDTFLRSWAVLGNMAVVMARDEG